MFPILTVAEEPSGTFGVVRCKHYVQGIFEKNLLLTETSKPY